MIRRAMLAALLTIAAPGESADVGRTIRIWGPPAMRGIAQRWADAYHRQNPRTSFELTMRGSDTAIPGLYGGSADIALMGRENDVVDDNGFARTTQYPLTRIIIANGALSVPGKSDVIAVLVSADNPVATLSLDQLDAVMNCSAERRRPSITRWGQLGVRAGWADRPIRLYGYDMASRTGAFFQKVALHDSRKMCWDVLAEFGDLTSLDGTAVFAADRVGRAARKDRFALAIANPAQAVDGLKIVPIVDHGHPVLPDDDTIVSERYPLARRAYAYLARPPGKPTDPDLRMFLDWVLGDDGQALLRQDHGYLPLRPETRKAQLAIVDGRR